MIERRLLLVAAVAAALLSTAVTAQELPRAAVRLNQLGPENQTLVQRAGLWDMTETVWASPDAAPVSTTGLVAERRIIGSLLQETLHPASDATDAAIKRIDYLSFNRVEGRWKYVSMDTRAPVGIMPASSYARGDDGRITLVFDPLTLVGDGPHVAGQMMRMQQVITFQSPDRDMKEQYFIKADGSGTMWLAHRYAYARRS